MSDQEKKDDKTDLERQKWNKLFRLDLDNTRRFPHVNFNEMLRFIGRSESADVRELELHRESRNTNESSCSTTGLNGSRPTTAVRTYQEESMESGNVCSNNNNEQITVADDTGPGLTTLFCSSDPRPRPVTFTVSFQTPPDNTLIDPTIQLVYLRYLLDDIEEVDENRAEEEDEDIYEGNSRCGTPCYDADVECDEPSPKSLRTPHNKYTILNSTIKTMAHYLANYHETESEFDSNSNLRQRLETANSQQGRELDNSDVDLGGRMEVAFESLLNDSGSVAAVEIYRRYERLIESEYEASNAEIDVAYDSNYYDDPPDSDSNENRMVVRADQYEPVTEYEDDHVSMASDGDSGSNILAAPHLAQPTANFTRTGTPEVITLFHKRDQDDAASDMSGATDADYVDAGLENESEPFSELDISDVTSQFGSEAALDMNRYNVAPVVHEPEEDFDYDDSMDGDCIEQDYRDLRWLELGHELRSSSSESGED